MKFLLASEWSLAKQFTLGWKGESQMLESELQLAEDAPFRESFRFPLYTKKGTRPDFGYALGNLSQYSERRNHGTMLDGEPGREVHGYLDSNWAGCVDSRNSASRYAFTIAGGDISWKSKTKAVIACEAEYIAACLAAKEAVSQLVENIWICSPEPIAIKVDYNG